MMVKKTNKKTKATKKEQTRQFEILYTVGTEPTLYALDATDYKLTTIDIKSMHKADVFSFPVLFAIDEIDDTADIIPMNNVGKIRYNWGFKEESTKFMSELEAMMKKHEATEAEKHTALEKKNKIEEHDRQYV